MFSINVLTISYPSPVKPSSLHIYEIVDTKEGLELSVHIHIVLQNSRLVSNSLSGCIPLLLGKRLIPSSDFFTWARDSSLTFKALVDAFIAGNSDLQPVLQNYICAQAQLQAIPNPSGDLSNGAGLGEPKFEV